MSLGAKPLALSGDEGEAISTPTDEIAAACIAGLAMTSEQSKCYGLLVPLSRLLQGKQVNEMRIFVENLSDETSAGNYDYSKC